ncbi:hypothetical protein [Clostridium butyricum]|uniref:hypothetical protein n=1 Tax=Clostridium butyricum TaxID=1492 RepID=UPI00168A4A4E|nr:hypothetical protein [Clostridium butyricum]MDB2150480.1 hypothetical protein [Clostridium butyricum]
MINKKISKIIGPAAGIMVFMMSIGIMPVQAYAAETQSIQNEASLSKSGNLNYEIEQNGVKLTITDIIGTRNKIKINATITREDGFDENINSHRSIELNMHKEKEESNGGGSSWSYPNKNTIEISSEEKSENGFSEKGNIRADLVIGEYDFNGSLVIPVDFTESFKQYMKADLDVNIEKNNKVLGFESDAIGTSIIVSRPVEDIRHGSYYSIMEPCFIIKVGNKMYRTDYIGGRNYSEDDETYTCNFESEKLTYNDIKDADSISIIPVKCTMTSDEIEEKYNDSSLYEKLSKEAVTENNVKYNKEVEFTDGTKGEIKVERSNNKIRVYCSSDSDIKSFMLAESINSIFTDGSDDYRNFVYEDDKVICKDENAENQYIAEFEDSHPEMMFETHIDTIMLNIHKFDIGDEIKIK